jgi:hypothetical protein
MIATIQIIFLTLTAVAFIMYFVYDADVEVAFVKGLLIGFSYNDTDYEEEKEVDHVAQVALGVLVLTLTWTESYDN